MKRTNGLFQSATPHGSAALRPTPAPAGPIGEPTDQLPCAPAIQPAPIPQPNARRDPGDWPILPTEALDSMPVEPYAVASHTPEDLYALAADLAAKELANGRAVSLVPCPDGSCRVEPAPSSGHRPKATADGTLSSTTVMARLGYSPKNRAGFWIAVRRAKIPFIRLNARNIRFPLMAFEDWLASRQVGGTRPAPRL